MAKEFFKIAMATAVSAVVVASLHGETVYQVSGSGNSSYYTASEYGDEIILGGSGRILTEFKFEYFANYNFAQGITFNLYDQTGPTVGGAKAPGALLYSSKVDLFDGGGIVSFTFPESPANTIPNRLTWTVQFSGAGFGDNKAGLIVPNASPTIGQSANDFWIRTGAGQADWALQNFGAGGPTANFVATVSAVPEPGTVALAVIGLGGLAFALRRRA